MNITTENIDTLAWQKMDNLIPAIVQHQDTGAVLMQAYMSQESLSKTLSGGTAVFYSRSKQALWLKGETSGNYLHVSNVITDCDKDSLLVIARPDGPSCHLGTESCFPEQPMSQKNFLGYLEHVIAQRSKDPIEESYTAKLLSRGTARVAQKVGEEGVEVALAAATNQKDEFIGECADLFYHTLVLLKDQNVSLTRVMQELEKRHQ